MKKDRKLYQSYLLRMWRESVEGDWRVSLVEVGTGETKNFVDLAEMFVYLCARSGRTVPHKRSEIKKAEEKVEYQT